MPQVARPGPEWGLSLPPHLAFLCLQGFSEETLHRAAKRAASLDVSVEKVLFASGALDESTYLDCLARYLGVRRPAAALRLDPAKTVGALLQNRIAPARDDDGRRVWVVVPTPSTFAFLFSARALDLLPHLVLASMDEFDRLLLDDHRQVVLVEAGSARIERSGHRSARSKASPGQRAGAAVFATLSLCSLLLFGWPAAAGLIAGLLVLLLAANTLQAAALLCHDGPFSPANARRPVLLGDRDLPVYTAIVALYREQRVVPALIKALRALDYPAEKLDIKLVLESDDPLTLEAVRRQVLPAQFSVVVMPPDTLKTKPKAMNAALLLARGSLVTIFDAEDEPEPGQLRKAASLFDAMPADVACLQAALIPDNAGDGWLQALFTIEYASLFSIVKRGLCALRLPVPLGGTSNHFRRDLLERAGAWDAYNVTEDAELGLRLWRMGLRVETLDSVTFEEAPPTLHAWFNQRRRWSKGWFQTLISHCHAPVGGMRRYGSRRWLLSGLSLAGTLAGMLVFPIGSIWLTERLLFGSALFSGDNLSSLLDGLALALVGLGVVIMFVPPILALRRCGLRKLGWYLPLLPLYSLAISAATWVSIYDLLANPFHWLKTEHGFARTSLRRRA